MPAEAFDLSNKFLVASTAEGIIVGEPLAGEVLSPDDAMLLAAWLVASAEAKAEVPFDELLAGVQRTT